MKSLKYEKKIKSYLKHKRSSHLAHEVSFKRSFKRIVKEKHLLDKRAELILKIILLKLKFSLSLTEENPFAQTNLLKNKFKKMKYLIGFFITLLFLFLFLFLIFKDFEYFSKNQQMV